jgi:hypothetical protein
MDVIDFFAEDELQAALAEHPELLVPCAVPETTGGHLLICRDAAIPAGISDTMGQPPDALFLDGDGRCFIVEAKLRYNGDLHRKVIGQAIDYLGALLLNDGAAWMQKAFRGRCSNYGLDATAEIR